MWQRCLLAAVLVCLVAACASGGRGRRGGGGDSGTPPMDAGPAGDSGSADAGSVDGGSADAGPHDAGGLDAGITCGAGQIVCSGLCVSTATDEDHCGGCDVACSASEDCIGGSCVAECAAGEVRCDGGCVDPATDTSWCGASGDCTGASAGEACAPGEVCAGGTCGAPTTPASCREAREAGLSVDGVYTIDPDGAGAGAPFDVYCDMNTDGGGWTLTYKIRNNVPSGTNPWWNMVMPGSGTAFPTTVAVPAGTTEGPTLATRASYTTATAATEWRASTYRAGAVVFDVKSSYSGTGGRALRCFAAGTCTDADQTCSTAVTDGRVLLNTLGGPIGAGGTGYVCDVGWTDCSYCVDWSSVRTDSSAGGSTTNAVRYVGDDSISLTDTTTFYWVR